MTPSDATQADTTTADATRADDAADAASEQPRRRSRGMDPENRRAVMDACALRTPPDGWRTNFVLMMVASIVVAVMGLSADSPALVIGAMLIAPLMVPVLGTAAATTMALRRALGRSITTLALASFGGVALAALLGAVLGGGSLSGEVLSRTSPDARDLVVALAAGAAGAYAMTRPDLSAALPGVAIAVALVPPIGVIGITLQAGRFDLARGAGLLYVTNLAAIVAAGIAVFVATGFAPPRRLEARSGQVASGTLLVLAALVAVAVPLTVASLEAAQESSDRDAVRSAVDTWLAGSNDDIDRVEVQGDSVVVEVSGLDEPPATGTLVRSVRGILGPDATVDVRWTEQRLAPLEAADATEEEILEEQVRAEVLEWLATGTGELDLTSLVVRSERIRVDISSVASPPPVDDLAARLRAELGLTAEVEVNWNRLTQLRPGQDDEPDTLEDRVARVAREWLPDDGDVVLDSVSIGSAAVVVDLVGTEEPAAIDELLDLLAEEVDDDRLEVTVFFTERRRLESTTTTTTTTTEAPGADDPTGGP